MQDILWHTPVHTLGDVWNLLRHHHVEVTRRELRSLQTKVEASLYALARELFAVQGELQQLGSEAREVQSQEARLSVVLGGFGRKCTPAERTHFIIETMMETPSYASTFGRHAGATTMTTTTRRPS